MAVKVILREDVANLGDAGDLVKVKPGYARNFLIPKGKAIFATAAKVKELEHHRRIIAENMAKQLKDLNAAKDRLEQLRLEVEAQAGEEGKLFGSVTTLQIVELVAAKGIEIDRRKIDLKEPIKELGDHEVPVKLHREVIAKLKLKVSPTPPQA
ncbi:MAG: 50S ribosomal protein L9 [bacterium]|nr:50S ribosomal protein L9 [bacterium]MCP5070962.1 50S ribosomal protein L9 [bacterium]